MGQFRSRMGHVVARRSGRRHRCRPAASSLGAKRAAPCSRAKNSSKSFAVYLAAAVVGLIAFSPFAAQTANRGALAFLTILPLMWAALGRSQRDTATAALILSIFAVWGTMAGTGPFASPAANDAFILLLAFMMSTTMPSLALAAEVAARAKTEARSPRGSGAARAPNAAKRRRARRRRAENRDAPGASSRSAASCRFRQLGVERRRRASRLVGPALQDLRNPPGRFFRRLRRFHPPHPSRRPGAASKSGSRRR